MFRAVEDWTRISQRVLLRPGQLAKEYSVADISPVFKPNCTFNPGGEEYDTHVAQNFINWRLKIDGLVQRPMSLSIAELRGLPSRTQITRHDCVEGWSAIGKWKGVPLAHVLRLARPTAAARYVVFHCADPMDDAGTKYYESIDLVDAFHPQTILAYEMNGATLPVAHGAPLRLRVERQLGYKNLKYLSGFTVADSLKNFGTGQGADGAEHWYSWYAGI